MEKRFYDYANLIIKNYEGGYYHPDMKASLKNGSNMGISGETMFGLDRTNGAGLFTSGSGKKFWDLIDAQDARHKWSYGYVPKGSLGEQLRKLAAETMYNKVYANSNYNTLSAKAKKLVAKSPKLESHLFYGCWNGIGYFKGFCDVLNKAVASGTTNLAKLEEIALNSRKNHEKSWMRQRANHMEDIWASLSTSKKILKVLLFTFGGAALVGGIVWLWRK